MHNLIQPPNLCVKLEVFTMGVTNLQVEDGKIVIFKVEYCYWIDEVLHFRC